MSARADSTVYDALWAAVEPQLRDVATFIEEVAQVRSRIETSHTTHFPLTASASFESSDERSDVVIEVSAHRGPRGFTFSVEVLREDGEILSPALVRRVPSTNGGGQLQRAMTQFLAELPSFLEWNVETVLDAVGTQSRELARAKTGALARPRSSHGLEPADTQGFVARARSILSDVYEQSLVEQTIRVYDKDFTFDLVSEDQMVVGEVKAFRKNSGIAQLSITAAIWRLQLLSSAEHRFLVTGPSPKPMDAWLDKNGAQSLRGVELWHLNDQATPMDVRSH